MNTPKVVRETNKHYVIEILPQLHIRVPKAAVRRYNSSVIVFRNPISRLTCFARL